MALGVYFGDPGFQQSVSWPELIVLCFVSAENLVTDVDARIPAPRKYVCSDDAGARAYHLRVVERVLRGKYFPWAGEGYDSHSEVVWWRPPNKKPRRVSVFDKSVGVVCCMGWLARRRAFCNLCEVARPLWYRII